MGNDGTVVEKNQTLYLLFYLLLLFLPLNACYVLFNQTMLPFSLLIVVCLVHDLSYTSSYFQIDW
jgi:hypothetical protein